MLLRPQEDLHARPPIVVARNRRIEPRHVRPLPDECCTVRKAVEVPVEDRSHGVVIEGFAKLEPRDEFGERGSSALPAEHFEMVFGAPYAYEAMPPVKLNRAVLMQHGQSDGQCPETSAEVRTRGRSAPSSRATLSARAPRPSLGTAQRASRGSVVFGDRMRSELTTSRAFGTRRRWRPVSVGVNLAPLFVGQLGQRRGTSAPMMPTSSSAGYVPRFNRLELLGALPRRPTGPRRLRRVCPRTVWAACRT